MFDNYVLLSRFSYKICRMFTMRTNALAGSSMSQAVRRSPSTVGVSSSLIGHSMWVSSGRMEWVLLGVSPVVPCYKFHSMNSSHSFRFISVQSPL